MDDQRSEVRLPTRPVTIDDDVDCLEYEEPVIPQQKEAVSRPSRWRLLKRLLWLVLVVLIVAAAVWYFPRPDTQPKEAGRGRFGGPVPVGVTTVQKGDMPVSLSQLGTVTPLATVTIKTQINGYLTEVAFREGQMVKKGDVLAQIDPRPYQVALEQAGATLAKDQALLKNAQLDLERYNTLVAQNSIARQTRDTQVSLVAQNQATIKADQAQIDVQKLNLTYCRIVSPVTGRVGLRQVDPGNYVQTSDPNGIVVVTQLQPISVIFTVAEDNLPAVMKRVRAGASLPVSAFDRIGTTELGTGTLETVDNQIDTTTGTVKLRAVFDNREEVLFPNQFVNVRLLVDTMRDSDIVPVAAIQRGAPGTFVYLVSPDNTVTVAKVKLGPSDGQRIAILSGLQPGESVVVDGADRLREGAKVTLAAPGKPDGTAPGARRAGGQSQAAARQSAPRRAEPEAAEPPALPPPAATTPPPEAKPPVAAPLRAPDGRPAPQAAENDTLLKRGDALLSTGDIASARLLYERAADAGDGRAALRLGATFDPNFLASAGVRGIRGDPGRAASWYRRARDLGETAGERWQKIL